MCLKYLFFEDTGVEAKKIIELLPTFIFFLFFFATVFACFLVNFFPQIFPQSIILNVLKKLKRGKLAESSKEKKQIFPRVSFHFQSELFTTKVCT